MSLFDLGGKCALVTGGTRGIGRAIAARLAEQGAGVALSGREAAAAERAAAEIGRGAIGLPCDMADQAQVAALVERTAAAFGRLDTVVGNAGLVAHIGPLARTSDADFERTMAVNLRGNFHLCLAALPHLVAAGGGTIVLIASVSGLTGERKLGAYGMAKAADMALARNIALEYGPRGVRANCIAPGFVRTDMTAPIWRNEAARAAQEKKTPLRRLGEPDDIAGVAVFLASAAGAFVTGQTIVADGGGMIVSQLD